MGRKGKVRHRKTVEQATLDSDDERLFEKEEVPDSTSDNYYKDDVDQFHDERDKIPFDESEVDEDEPEEVLELDDSDEDDEAIKSIKDQLKKMRAKGIGRKKLSDDEDEFEDVVDEEKAASWGKGRKSFIGADDDLKLDRYAKDEEASAAVLEEKEARVIQRRLAEQLDNQALGLDALEDDNADRAMELSDEEVDVDVDALTTAEKKRLLQQRAPELKILLKLNIQLLKELRDRLCPCLEYLKEQNAPQRKLYDQLKKCDSSVEKEIDVILEAKKLKKSLHFDTQSLDAENISDKQSASLMADEESNDIELRDDLLSANDAEKEENEKRAITYEMAKNKGLTPHRKKEQRNPRVKHRLKYRKKLIARKGQVREVRKELAPYSGEISGIRAGVKKSRRLK